jgi:Polysaccharide pyruvyl transferase
MSRSFGLLVYNNTNNLGDEIQSIAARAFLPSVDYMVDREALHNFSPSADGKVAVILNGWFLHHPENWPPSEALWPLLISFHVSNWGGRGIGLCAANVLLKEPVAKYLRGFSPVGARDTHTLDLLRAAGVESYLSGCLTMTLERPKIERDESVIVLNDVSDDVSKFVRKQTDKHIVSTQHRAYWEKDIQKRFAEAERLLKLYAHASCVITNRLHCALPCLAFETPVLLLDAVHDRARFDGVLDFLHHCSGADLISGDYRYDVNDPPCNSDSFHPYRAGLIQRVQSFVDIALRAGSEPEYPLSLSDRYSALAMIHSQTVKLLDQERARISELTRRATAAT